MRKSLCCSCQWFEVSAVLSLPPCSTDEYRASTAAARPAGPAGRPLRRGDVAGLLRTLRRDFLENSYFVTGVLDNAQIYSPDCLFADPTISFRGGWRAAGVRC